MLNQEQRSFVGAVEAVVNEVVTFAEEFSDAMDVEPDAGSQADRELNNHNEVGPKGPWGRKPVEDAYNVASVLYGAAGQYLRAFGQLLNDDVVLFGFQAITRALLEAAARSWWVLDPACTVRERVERAYVERYYSFSEMKKVAQAIGGDLVLQVERDTHLQVETVALGLRERTKKGSPLGPPSGVGVHRPDSVDLVSDLLKDVGVDNGAVWYRTFSGIIHSALYSQVGHWQPVSIPGTRRHRLEPQMLTTAISEAAVLSIGGYFGVIGRHAMLYGRDWKQLEGERLSAISRITALQGRS